MPDHNNKMCLKQVTLVAITSVKLYETVRAMQYSMRGIEFGDVVLLSDKRPFYLPKTIRHETIRHLGNVDDYSHFCVYELANHIKTDYALIVHHDGFVVNPRAWRTEFLKYDYVGSPWPLPKDSVRYRDPSGNIVRVGNGVSLRSKRLLELPSVENLPWENGRRNVPLKRSGYCSSVRSSSRGSYSPVPQTGQTPSDDDIHSQLPLPG
mgnify:CR=1 FL=1